MGLRENRSVVWGIAAAAFAVGLFVALYFAFWPSAGTTAPRQGVRRILESPGRWVGKRVLVRGQAATVFHPYAVLLGPQVPGRNRDLLVIPKNGKLPTAVHRDRTVRVVGVVRRWNPKLLEGRASTQWLETTPLLKDFRGKPVIVATSIRRA
jgi:hypothetical protein